MKKHQIHFGKKFYQDKKTGYWISTTSPRIRAHVWVWKNSHNEIPKGWHVHHRDENKSNNCISNLTIMSLSAHVKHHLQNDQKRKIKAKEHLNNIRDLTKPWHKSHEGRTWHKLHAIKNNFGKFPLKEFKCKLCNKIYKSRSLTENMTKFCSNKCKSKWRRDSGIDNIKYVCENCEKEFEKNKYAKTKFCSKNCGLKFSWKKRKKL